MLSGITFYSAQIWGTTHFVNFQVGPGVYGPNFEVTYLNFDDFYTNLKTSFKILMYIFWLVFVLDILMRHLKNRHLMRFMFYNLPIYPKCKQKADYYFLSSLGKLWSWVLLKIRWFEQMFLHIQPTFANFFKIINTNFLNFFIYLIHL